MQNPDAEGKLISKWILKNKVECCHSCSEQGSVAGSCEHGNESSVSIKGGEFLTS
jgi:hypothetical protein